MDRKSDLKAKSGTQHAIDRMISVHLRVNLIINYDLIKLGLQAIGEVGTDHEQTLTYIQPFTQRDVAGFKYVGLKEWHIPGRLGTYMSMLLLCGPQLLTYFGMESQGMCYSCRHVLVYHCICP